MLFLLVLIESLKMAQIKYSPFFSLSHWFCENIFITKQNWFRRQIWQKDKIIINPLMAFGSNIHQTTAAPKLS